MSFKAADGEESGAAAENITDEVCASGCLFVLRTRELLCDVCCVWQGLRFDMDLSETITNPPICDYKTALAEVTIQQQRVMYVLSGAIVQGREQLAHQCSRVFCA